MPKTVHLSDCYWACVQSRQLPKSETMVPGQKMGCMPHAFSNPLRVVIGNPEVVMDLERKVCHTGLVMSDAGPDMGEVDIHTHTVYWDQSDTAGLFYRGRKNTPKWKAVCSKSPGR